MAWVLGLKAANYHHGVHKDAPERYLGGIERPGPDEDGDFPPPVVNIVDRIEDAERFASEMEAEYAATDFRDAMREARLHHDTGYATYPVRLKNGG